MSGCERVVVAQMASGSGAVGLVGIDLDGRLLQLSNQHIQQLRAGVHRLGYHRCGHKGQPASATGASTPEGISISNGGQAILEKRGASRGARGELSRGSNRGADRRTDRGDES